MREQSFEILLSGVPYFVRAVPFEFNGDKRFRVTYNEGNEHIFAYDSQLGTLSAIDDDAIEIPDDLESAISSKLLNNTVA